MGAPPFVKATLCEGERTTVLVGSKPGGKGRTTAPRGASDTAGSRNGGGRPSVKHASGKASNSGA